MPTCRPVSVLELSQAVAESTRSGQRVRAVGSLTAFSNVAQTDGLVVHTDQLTERLSLPPLASGWEAEHLVRVQCGRTVQSLQHLLMAEGRMLRTTPAFTGQTLASAVSTASHGTGLDFGPLCDEVVSVDMVVDEGRLLRVEPEGGPTDRSRYAGALIQCDATFYSVIVGLGSMGVHVSYTLRTTPLVHLRERRYVTRLDEALEALRDPRSRLVTGPASPSASPATRPRASTGCGLASASGH